MVGAGDADTCRRLGDFEVLAFLELDMIAINEVQVLVRVILRSTWSLLVRRNHQCLGLWLSAQDVGALSKVRFCWRTHAMHDRRTVFLMNECQTSEGFDHSRNR